MSGKSCICPKSDTKSTSIKKKVPNNKNSNRLKCFKILPFYVDTPVGILSCKVIPDCMFASYIPEISFSSVKEVNRIPKTICAISRLRAGLTKVV